MIQPTITFDKIQLFNADNMGVMKQYPDKYFDIAIVDVEYNIGASKQSKKPEFTKQKNGNYLKVKKTNSYIQKDWDFKECTSGYFNELKRVSVHQIIWGGNYYGFKGGYIVWDKLNGDCDQFGCEMAYQSFNKRTDIVYYLWQGMFQGIYCGKDVRKALTQQGNKQLNEERIHPTQKPVALYSWIIKNYVKPNMKILDTHLGSGSQTIAIDKANTIENMNLEFVGIEIDSEYFNASVQRFKNYKQQITIFD